MAIFLTPVLNDNKDALRVQQTSTTNRLSVIEPFGHQGFYQLHPVFGHSSFPSFLIDRDVEARKSGSASSSITDGRLTISTGSTAGSTYRYETARFTEYQSGTSTIASIGLGSASLPTGDGVLRGGIGSLDSSNNEFDSAHFEWFGGGLDVVVVTNGVERYRETIDLSSFDTSLDPTGTGLLVGVEYVWYGVGPIYFKLWEVDKNQGDLVEINVAEFWPGKFWTGRDFAGEHHFSTPNLPVFAEVDNGTAAEDVNVKIGGRRAAVRGNVQRISRPVSAFRNGISVTSSGDFEPLLAMRAKSEWPTGQLNNLVASSDEYQVLPGGAEVVYALFDVPRGTLSGTWGPPDKMSADQTGIEVNTGPGNMVGPFPRSRYRIALQQNPITGDVEDRTQLIRDRELVLAAADLSGSGTTVACTMSAAEEGR